MKNRMSWKSIVTAVCALVIVSCATATQPTGSGEVGRGQEELGYLVGTWTLSGGLESHPMYSSAGVNGTMTCEWFEGRYAVICRVEQSGAAGTPTRALRIFGYSSEAKAFTSYGLTDSHHISTDVILGSFRNGTWSFSGEQLMNGRTVKIRESLRQISPTQFELSQEQMEGGAWRKLAAATFAKTAS